MDNSDVINLLTVDYITDESGTPVTTVAKNRAVFCSVSSVGMKETYAALAVGHNPEIRVTITESADYEGENFALYHGRRYKVLRTYQSGLAIELTLEQTTDLAGVI